MSTFDPFDPVGEAFKQLHGANLIAAKDARIKQLEAELATYREPGQRIPVAVAEQAVTRMQERIDLLVHAGKKMHTYMHKYAEDVGLDNDWDDVQVQWENAVKMANK